MGSPRLPSNPMTISDGRERANTWTVETVRKRYGDRILTGQDIAQIRGDLAELKSWDDYERHTCEQREQVKGALQTLLSASIHAG